MVPAILYIAFRNGSRSLCSHSLFEDNITDYLRHLFLVSYVITEQLRIWHSDNYLNLNQGVCEVVNVAMILKMTSVLVSDSANHK